ncbi:MAG: FAD-dependent oxidoreductase [candidate division WOR-3 bacterium]|nr:MAG: FAD-dependent oxidoreductase [candidate division WOR-3 bacterium]
MDVGRHPNIEIFANSEVVGVEGEAPDFKVKVRRKSTFVDWDKCTGCGECPTVCPVHVNDEFQLDLSKREAIYRRYPQAVPNKFLIDKKGSPPCRYSCPAGVNAQGYIALISQGKYKEALELERRDNPFPAVCGRVCTHPCESDCKRKDVDEPLAIAQLKRFISDREPQLSPANPALDKEKVAVVGAGPAGLSAAYFLAKRGYRPTVFEATDHPGGLLYWAIPRFRLPEAALMRDLDHIKSWGVEVRTGAALGKDFGIKDLFKQDYKAIFLGLGAAKEKSMGIDGEDLQGVVLCVQFLNKAVHDPQTPVGKRVAVVGGGNSAVDAVRTAVRLGAEEAFIVYRRSRQEMPANEEEIVEAEKEGVKIHYLTNPTKIFGKDGKVTGMECIKMKLGEPDSSGRRKPIPIEGSEFTMNIDMVIMAIGQAADVSFLTKEENFELTRWGTFAVDPDTLQTSIPGIFAGGDAVTGPATVIEAIAAGKEAAESIDRYIRGVDPKENRKKKDDRVRDEDIEIPDDIQIQKRTAMPMLDPEKAKKNFEEVGQGFSDEQARKESNRCLSCAGCSECLECVKVCEPNAIVHEMVDEYVDLDVGSIIVTTGVDYLDPTEASEYGYKRFKNVYTSFEIERIMSEDGPTAGKLPLGKELTEPLSFAFIQCVGSRNMRHDINYCSRICCMNTIKDSLVLKEHYPDANIVVFYIDIRAFGKGFEEFYNRSLEKGVKYIKGKPSKIIEDDQGSLVIHYEDEDGHSNKMLFDAVCLSSALIPSKGCKDLAEVLGVDTDEDGFFKNTEPAIMPLESTKKGILVCGCATGPKDITDSIAEASGAAVKAACFLEGHELPIEKKEIEQVDVSGPPRVGVFVCHCGPNISKVVDVKAVVEYAKTLPDVVFAEDYAFACSETAQHQIQERIAEYKLNRVVVAACTPKTHEISFQDSLTAVGLNPYLFDIANIRNQCSWVHQKEPEKATEKARELVRMSVARVRKLGPLFMKELSVNRDVAIIGAGITGLRCGIDLLQRGYKVKIIEKKEVSGGLVRHLSSIYPSFRAGKDIIEKLIKEFTGAGGELLTSTELVDVTGYVGNFGVKVKRDAKESEFTVGAIVLATGSELYDPAGRLGRDRFPNVITNMELEEKILSGGIEDVKSVAFLQCIGSRGDGNNPGCSRYCCQAAIKEAIYLKERGIDVAILNRGVRVYSKGAERMYRKARELGVLFLPYEGEPEISGTDKAQAVTVPSSDIDADITIPVDLVVLSVGMVPAADSGHLSEVFKVPRGPDKFFLERHSKFGPVETTVEGVFLCGCCQFPQDIGDSISQASAVASKVAALLSRDKITLAPITSTVIEEYCRGCGRCAEVCEFHAIELVEKEKGVFTAKVNEALCKGCGTCVAACPTGAIDLRHFRSEQIEAQLEALFG